MKIGLMTSGELGLKCLQYFLKKNINIICVLTDKNSLPIIQLCKEMKIDCFQGNPRKKDPSVFIASHIIDVLLSVNYLFLVEENIISWPKIIAVNFHGSLLPLYRGRTPHVWAIINGEKKTGITGHIMVKECDAGDIVVQKEILIEDDTTGGQLLEQFNKLYPQLVEEVLNKIEKNQLEKIPQEESKATYVGKRIPEDGVIDWNWSVERVRNWIRAQSYPYPGAFTFFYGNKVIIDSVDFYDCDFDENSENGCILKVNPEIIVKVSNGLLRINKIRNSENLALKSGEVFSSISYRDVNINEDLYFNWVNDSMVRENFFNQEVISLEKYFDWFQNKLHEKDSLLLVFINERQSLIGQIRIDRKEDLTANLAIDFSQRGKDYASKILKIAIEQYYQRFGNHCEINAFMKKGNISSKKEFEKVGFILIENSKEHYHFKYIFTPQKD